MVVRIARVHELCRQVSELVSYSIFPAVTEKPAKRFLSNAPTRLVFLAS